MRLKDKRAIVTGGGRGIGRGIVEAFLKEGASVLACGRSTAPDGLPPDCTWMTADVSSAEDMDRLAETAGAADILVNNAGVQVERTVLDSTDADWDLVIGVNCKGVFNACRAVLPRMRAGGSIINVGSVSGRTADPGMALYNASKAFVHGLTRSIAVDHGPKVRCNAICPGWIDTGMLEAGFGLASDPDVARQDALLRHATRRFGRPEDIAAIAVWLASDEAGFATGQLFTVDGGMTAASPISPGMF